MSDDLDNEFARLVGPVRRLRHDRIEPEPVRPRLRRTQPAAASDGDAALREVGDPPSQTETRWFHQGLQKKRVQRIRRGELPIDAHLDLHGQRREEAIEALSTFLQQALDEGCRFLVIVHGQGYGSRQEAVLKPLTRHWLSQQPEVLAWCPAQPRHGGGGATYVYLRRATD